MGECMKKVRLYRNVLIVVMVVLIIVIGILSRVIHIKKSERMREDWLLQQEARLPYDYAKNATAIKLPKDSSNWSQDIYESSYDFDGDMSDENVLVQFLEEEDMPVASIRVDGMEPLAVELEQGQDDRTISIVGMTVDKDKMLAVVENVFKGGDKMGYVRCHVFSIAGDVFIKQEEVYYSGAIGKKGLMVKGVIANGIQNDSFRYDVEEDQNEYIYERSRIFADLRDLGIKLPYETINNPNVTYKKNVIGIFNIIVS